MIDDLNKIKQEALNQLNTIRDLNSWRELEIKYLGRKGELTRILRGLVQLDAEAKKTVGAAANEIKKELESKFNEVKVRLEKESGDGRFVDVTMPGEKFPEGHLHPVTIVTRELEKLFTSMGFMLLEGPELESDYFNFTALNVLPNHPARDMQDTFYVDVKNKNGEYDLVMRTHTSPVQVRSMKKYGAPVRFIVPGRCFRCEATDARHEHTFYQMEGVMIDKNISLSNLKAILETVAKALYGKETKVRLRPKFYPFVEPGMNGEVTCYLCQGKGCRVCKYTGWLEVFGSGMIHPNVLKAGGVNPEIYSGFAFGFGLDRLVMLKYGIDDTRLFNSADLRFIEQF